MRDSPTHHRSTMPITDLLIPEFDQEMAITRRVLERVPDDDGAWRPHPKSFPIAHLAQLVARMPSWVTMVLRELEVDIAPVERQGPGYTIEKTATLLAEFDHNVAAARDVLAATTDADFDVTWTMKAAGRIVSQQSRYLMLRTGVINHLVHHRAQLGVYIRLKDVPVPSMYGPTADERM
jgi:uncharacterized damage-inducible protein DinB